MTDERSPNGHVLITNRAHTINIENGKILTVTSWQTQLSRPFLSLARYLSVCLLISVANCGVRNIELSIFMGIFKMPASHRQISLSFSCVCVSIFLYASTPRCAHSQFRQPDGELYYNLCLVIAALMHFRSLIYTVCTFAIIYIVERIKRRPKIGDAVSMHSACYDKQQLQEKITNNYNNR